MKTSIRYSLAAAVMTAMLAGCATSGGGYYGQQDPYGQGPDPANDRTKRGAIIGAAVGAVAGLLSGDDATERRQRALVGAGVGGLAGGAIGNYQDRQERALRERMAGTGVDVVRQGDNITFGFDSSALQSQFYPVLDDVAATLREYNQTIVEVAGHTDSKGTDAYNQELSVWPATSTIVWLYSRSVAATSSSTG